MTDTAIADEKKVEQINEQFETGSRFVESEDVRGIAEQIMREHHPHLCEFRFAYLLREKSTMLLGKRVCARAVKISGVNHFLANQDFAIVVAWDVWQQIGAETRAALIDHELCHCGSDCGTPVAVPHDVEEFRAIIDRHGFWTDELEAFVAQVDATQMRLSFDAKPSETVDKRTGEVIDAETPNPTPDQPAGINAGSQFDGEARRKQQPASSEPKKDSDAPQGNVGDSGGIVGDPVSGISDDLYADAVKLVVKARRAGLSFLQRHCDLNYTRAKAILDRMAVEGIIFDDGNAKYTVIKGAKSK